MIELAIMCVVLFAVMVFVIYLEAAHAKERKDLLNRIMAKNIDEYSLMGDSLNDSQSSRRPRNFVAAHQRKNGIRKTVLGDESQEYPDEL